MEDNTILYLKRTSPKPHPVKGAWAGGYSSSPATRASIRKMGGMAFSVEVWDLRRGSSWSECSDCIIESLEEAKRWLVEHYGGKWYEDPYI